MGKLEKMLLNDVHIQLSFSSEIEVPQLSSAWNLHSLGLLKLEKSGSGLTLILYSKHYMLEKFGCPDLNVFHPPQINDQHPRQLNKSKFCGLFGSYQINSTDNPANSSITVSRILI